MISIIFNTLENFWDLFKEDLIVGLIVAGVSAIVWMMSSQVIFNNRTSKSIIVTNNNLSAAILDAATDFKIAMACLKQQNEDQRLLCDFHRRQTEELSRRIGELSVLVDRLFEILGTRTTQRKRGKDEKAMDNI